MRTIKFLFVFLSLLIPLEAQSTFAQVATGRQPFGSFGGGPVDTVNLANLNVRLNVPIRSKAGRGLNFTYALAYDTAVWYPYASIWTPVYNFGWTAQTETETGYVTAKVQTWKCFSGGSWYFTNTYSAWAYYDKMGTPHPFNLPTLSTCPTFSSYATGTATDGSGYQISASPGSARLVDAGGHTLNPPFGTGTGPATAEDSNGNEITFNGTTYTDTLGQTPLTISGTNPVNYSYTAPSGATAKYVVSYRSYTVKTNFGCTGITEYGPASVSLVDKITLPDNTYYQFTYESTPGYGSDVTGRVASIRLPTGGTINYTYSAGSHGITCADGSTATLTRATPDGTWQYAHSENGSAWTTIITDPLNEQTTLNFQDYFVNTSTYQARGEYETQRQVRDSSNNLLQTVVTCYNGNTSNCNSTAVTTPLTRKTAFIQWPGGLQSETDTYYNNYGLVYQAYEYGYGSPGSLQRQTLISYASLGNDIQNRPQTVTVEDGQNNVVSQTSYQYDQTSVVPTSNTPHHAAISGSRGNPTTITYTVSSSATLSKTFTYFDTGNVDVATDVNGANTTYNYQDATSTCGNAFPTSVTEPLNYSVSFTWNCVGGVEASVTDENGRITSTAYNDSQFWRPNSFTDQSLNVTNIAYNAQTSIEGTLNFASSAADTLATFDALGRPHVSQLREGPGSGTYDSIETDYDSLGRPIRTTLPYAQPAGQPCSGNCPATSTSYDALGRPASVTDSGNGTSSYSYTQNDAYVTAGPQPTGENTKRKQLEYDALGRLTSVCEITSATGTGTCAQTNSQTGFWTRYKYDAAGRLIGVCQNTTQPLTVDCVATPSAGQQTRTFAYDDLGRMTSETNPESGTTTYTYDTDATCGTSNGDLVKKVDADGNTTCSAYDALHRVTSVTYPSGSYAAITPQKYFVYGPATGSVTVNGVIMTNAKVRLAEAYTCYSPCTSKFTDEGFSYTARGEVSDVWESTPHSGTYYHVNESYWPNGAVNFLNGVNGMLPTLPGLPTITYNVDGEGRVYSATSSSGQNPLSSTTYNVASLPLQVNLGSSDSDSFAYDQNTNRMTQYTFSVNGQSLIGNLTWNALGTLGSLLITDPFNSSNSQSCTYSHDDLVRIASANCGSAANQTFSFDAFGNINKAGTPYSFQPTYSTATNHMTQIGGSTPSYDANGNVTNDFLHTYAWDADGRPNTIDGVGITYDALGRIVEQNRSGAYTQVVYTPSGAKLALMNGSTLQKGFVPLAGGAMAVYNSSGLAYYRHSDWLGSSRLASTPSRTIYSDGAYAPFGEPCADRRDRPLLHRHEPGHRLEPLRFPSP